MEKLKTGTLLIILGNLLYLAYTFFSQNESSNFGDFSNGLLLGISIGCNLVGIILIVTYMSKDSKKDK